MFFRFLKIDLKLGSAGGLHNSEVASYPAAPGLILVIPKNFSLDEAEIY